MALWLVGKIADVRSGVEMAANAIDQGKAKETLDGLRAD
jgi:anthranilate phosphoribosyltransferase